MRRVESTGLKVNQQELGCHMICMLGPLGDVRRSREDIMRKSKYDPFMKVVSFT